MLDTFPCPKCGRRLQRSGAVAVDGAECPVFQCDECITPWTVEGEVFDTAFTFAVNPQGEPFDPGTDTGDLPI